MTTDELEAMAAQLAEAKRQAEWAYKCAPCTYTHGALMGIRFAYTAVARELKKRQDAEAAA